MKLFVKIFLCGIAVLSVALSVSGYLLISTSFENAMERERERVLDRYQLVKFSIQASMLTSDIDWEDGEQIAALPIFENMYNEDVSHKVGIFSENKTTVYSELPKALDFNVLNEVDEDSLIYSSQSAGNRNYMLVAGKMTQGDWSVYLAASTDITDVVQDKYQMEATFKMMFGITLAASMLILLLLSVIITRPIRKLTEVTADIAGGNYKGRTNIRALDEIGELGERFDYMAEVLEDKIKELEKSAQQKEDFVGNFAHELKTPLTSIIGYSDMIYQKELTKEGVKNAAGFILKEGLRLEALSGKLMDLVVLNKQKFILEELKTTDLFEDIVSTMMPLLEKEGVILQAEAEEAYISVEYDLFKTMILNFIDNAVKADSSGITLFGMRDGDLYYIRVKDNGRGMESAELERITEAFYMVDKSRARKQHGAGLGLALASKIAEIHNGTISFESLPGSGTTVSLALKIKEAPAYE